MGRHNPDDPTTAKYRKGWGWNPGDAMDGQGDLFSLARESDPQTSHDAVPSPGSRARQKAALESA